MSARDTPTPIRRRPGSVTFGPERVARGCRKSIHSAAPKASAGTSQSPAGAWQGGLRSLYRKRSVGVQTFWFQAVCQNHIVWDAVEVVEFSRKHTANVHDSLREIRGLIEGLVEKRDQRRDGFVRVIRKAMETKLGEDTDEVMDVLNKRGITRKLAKEAIEVARLRGGLTIFAVVDALTRIAGKLKNGGDRTEADAKASALLALAVTA